MQPAPSVPPAPTQPPPPTLPLPSAPPSHCWFLAGGISVRELDPPHFCFDGFETGVVDANRANCERRYVRRKANGVWSDKYQHCAWDDTLNDGEGRCVLAPQVHTCKGMLSNGSGQGSDDSDSSVQDGISSTTCVDTKRQAWCSQRVGSGQCTTVSYVARSCQHSCGLCS